MDTFTNAVYFMTKFQKGEPETWSGISNIMHKNIDGMSVSQLSKTLLAFVMNDKYNLTPETTKKILNSILHKFDRATATDIYYLCLSIGHSLGSQNLVPSDVYYAIYLKQLQMIEEYDLYQLQKISFVLCSP